MVLLILLVSVMAFLLNNESALDGDITASVAASAEAEYVAAAGLTHATWGAQNSGCAGDMTMTTVPFGQGSYTATVDAGGVTATQYTFTPDRDGFIDEGHTDNNYSGDDLIKVKNKSGDILHGVYHYDLSSIPTSQKVVTATAWFYVDKEDDEGAVTLHPVTADWTDASLTWDAVGGKFESQVYGRFPLQPVAGVWVSANVTALAQNWVSNPDSNYGFLLYATSDDVESIYTSREFGTASLRPYLEVTTADAAVSPVAISATGTLNGNPSPANDITRTRTRSAVPVYQPGTNLVFQPGAASGKDAEIWDQAPNNNYGDAAETWVSSATNDTTRSLLRFNTGAIPAGAEILEAALSLRRRSGSGADQPISAHRILNPWSEASVTWNRREAGTNWDTAGSDFDSIAVATTPVGPVNQRYEWDITPLVQGWVDGRYPNYGVVLVAAIPGLPGERFYTSDESQLDRRPSLSVTYTCECGSACLVPQGSGIVMMVVVNPTTLVPADAYKKALFESWGYTVNIIGENANAATYMAVAATNDVFYISETVNSNQVGTRIKDVPIGVVSQDGSYNSDLGFATGSAWQVDSEINVTDTSHYITAVFPTGPLDIFSAGMEQLTVSGTGAPGLQTLADTGGAGSLVVLDKGALGTGGAPLAGRRVMLPLGRDTSLNWDYLNASGRLLVQRALQWGTGNTGAPPENLLLVVVDPGSLTAQEDAKKALFESWGYAVSLIDEADSQGNFDTAVAASDVVYITEDVASGTVGTKLVSAPIGVVTEEDNLSDEFGLSAGIAWETGTAVTINNNTHYITSPFPTGALTILTSTESLAYVTGAQSPDLGKLASSTSGYSVVTLEAGASTFTGGFAAGRRVQLPWGGDNFDLSHLNADGLTLLQRALEWGAGASAAAPQTILFVVPDATALTAQDTAKKALMESWGYSVALITAADSQANFDAAVASADVAYISEEAISSDTNTKLRDATIGVVNEETALTDEFGIAGVRTGYTGTDIEVVDTSHYITSVFASGPLTIASAPTALNRLTGSLAPGLDALAETTGDPELAAIETGWALYDSGTAAGRRVQLPWGSDAFDINLLTADGQTLMRRAIEWGAGVGAATAPIAHWKFDEGSGPTAFDAVGGNDATLNGNPAWTTGTLGGALDFDGSGDYVTTNNNFTPPPVGTVTFWMQVSGSPASHGRILGLHDTWEIRHVTTGTPDGIPYGLVFDLGLSGVNTEFVTTTTIDTPGQWYHVAASYDTTNDAYAVYIDGVPHKSGTYPSALAVPAANLLSIGTRTGSSNYFDGILDDVRVYDQFLSAAEIADLAAGGGGGGGGGGSPTIVEVRVATGNDDAEERVSNGNVNRTSSDLELISDGSNAQLVGMRFTGVAVPNGATISNAWIQFKVDETNTGATNVNIQGEASDSALQFTTANSNISSRSRTTASIPWAPVPWTTVGEAGPDQQTPDISAAIQEIVNRPGWASGNDMVMLISGSGERTAEAYNGDAAGAALLHIEY